MGNNHPLDKREIDRLYLAHPLAIRHDTRYSEIEFESLTEINLINPFYDVKKEDIQQMDKGKFIPRTIKSKITGLQIIMEDLNLIDKCQGILAIVENDKESLGTPMEVFYNSYILKRPTYVITESCGGHPWIKGLSTKIFRNWQECIKYFQES